MEKCESCGEMADMLITIDVFSCKLATKHSLNVCDECYQKLATEPCPVCKKLNLKHTHDSSEKAETGSRGTVADSSSTKKEVKKIVKSEIEEQKVDPKKLHKEAVLKAAATTGECFHCHDKEEIFTIILTKCFTRTHQIPTCPNCSSEMNMMACPVCEAEELKRPMDQHIFLFCQDMILACEVKTNEAYWSYINFVDACPQVDFCYFPEQAACTALYNSPYQMLIIGGYNIHKIENDPCCEAAVSSQCISVHFSHFDFVFLDEAPSLNEPRFLHCALTYSKPDSKECVVF